MHIVAAVLASYPGCRGRCACGSPTCTASLGPPVVSTMLLAAGGGRVAFSLRGKLLASPCLLGLKLSTLRYLRRKRAQLGLLYLENVCAMRLSESLCRYISSVPCTHWEVGDHSRRPCLRVRQGAAADTRSRSCRCRVRPWRGGRRRDRRA